MLKVTMKLADYSVIHLLHDAALTLQLILLPLQA